MPWSESFKSIFCLLVFLECVVISSGRLSPHDDLGEPQTNLVCIDCHTLTSGKSCILLPNDTQKVPRKHCVGKENHCRVRRLSFTTSVNKTKKLWALDRGCVDKCVDGCVSTGERTRLFVCTTCCNDKNLCNTGNFATSIYIICQKTFVFLFFIQVTIAKMILI